MKKSEYNYLKFEHELSSDSPDEAAIDFLAVEAKLFLRIQASDRLGVLDILKSEIIAPFDFFDTIEKKLTTQILNYREYEEPIDECIKHHHDLTQAQWERLECKLNKKLYSVHGMPFWEIYLKTPEIEPSPEHWEILEQKIFTQINTVEHHEPWELYTKSDEVIIPGEFEKAEFEFEKRLKSIEHSKWEQVVKSEEVLLYSKWEDYEDKLFKKIEKHSDIPKQPFWYIIENYSFVLKSAGLVAAMLIVITGITGYLNSRHKEEIQSVVYQMQGEAALCSELSGVQNNSFRSINGGFVAFVNDHGTVALQNETKVELQRVSKKNVHYRVQFNDNPLNRKNTANVSFFVKKNNSRNAFKVETPDYDIIVKGTYFKIEPDISGRMSTQVLEGVVKIHSKEFGDTLLYAGQSIAYDLYSNRYAINASGPVIQREEIEQTPATMELLNYQVITIKCDNPESIVLIDGKFFGYMPLTIRQPLGQHRILIKKTGYSAIDTLINLIPDSNVVLLDLRLQKIEKGIESDLSNEKDTAYKVNPEKVKQPLVKVIDAISPGVVAERLLGVDPEMQNAAAERYYSAQKAEITGNWQKAISLYQEVFDNPASSSLRKEDALFSVGKLRAEHESDISEAKQVFLRYLAMYPDGSFSGESWLRLAELEFATIPENSIHYYNKFFEMFPRHPRLCELQNRVGVINLQCKRYHDAITMFKLALRNCTSSRDSERKQIYTNLYRALEESGDTKAAEIIRKELAELK